MKTIVACLVLTSAGFCLGQEVELVEKPQLAGMQMTKYGAIALAIEPKKWKHAETKNFYLHYRRVTEAKKVARETEFYAEFLIDFLGAKPEAGAGKSNVFVFEDDDEWKSFAHDAGVPEWTGSFALGDELYLNIRESREGRFNSHTLAHETAHAVIARLYPRVRLPLWLNEGFAEYVAGVAMAARKGQYTKGNQRRLEMADLPIAALQQLNAYPPDPVEVARLYQTSEKVVRVLVNEHGKERFAKMVNAMAMDIAFEVAFKAAYGDLYPDLDSLQKKVDSYRK